MACSRRGLYTGVRIEPCASRRHYISLSMFSTSHAQFVCLSAPLVCKWSESTIDLAHDLERYLRGFFCNQPMRRRDFAVFGMPPSSLRNAPVDLGWTICLSSSSRDDSQRLVGAVHRSFPCAFVRDGFFWRKVRATCWEVRMVCHLSDMRLPPASKP